MGAEAVRSAAFKAGVSKLPSLMALAERFTASMKAVLSPRQGVQTDELDGVCPAVAGVIVNVDDW